MFQGSFKDVLRKVQKLCREITGNSQGRLKKVKKNVFQKIFGSTIFFDKSDGSKKILGQKIFWVQNISVKKYCCPKKFWVKNNILDNEIYCVKKLLCKIKLV